MRSTRVLAAIAVFVCSIVVGNVQQVLAQSDQAQASQTSPAAPQDPQPQTPAKDPAATPAKPTRSFLGALVHNLGDDVKHMPRQNSIYWLVGGGGLALAVHPADNKVNRHFLGSTAVSNFYVPGKYIGSTYVQIGTSLTTYIVGRATEQPRTQHIGMDLLEAQILSETIVEGIKLAVRRQRPRNPDGTQSSSASTFSFPSGHSAVTFASATVFQQHFGWKAAVPTYAIATYVATSRLHDNRHYLSDVVFGAATGIIIGRSVTWHGRNTYTLAAVPLPGGGMGAVITW